MSEIDQMRKALEFYADRDSDGYRVDVTDYGLSTEEGEIVRDRGKRARDALATQPATSQQGKAVCAQCRGARDDLASGRDPEELCDPCYDDAVVALASSSPDAAGSGGDCTCARRYDPDQFDHEAGCADPLAGAVKPIDATQAREAEAERVLAAFNGGMVSVPDETNPRGFTTCYCPLDAMRAALNGRAGA